MAIRSLYWCSFLAALSRAETSVSVKVVIESEGPANWPTNWQSNSWWPNPPFETETGPIVPHRSKASITTSLTNIPSYTWPTTPVISLTPYPNSTSTASPTSTKLPNCKKIQYEFAPGSGSNAARAEAIKDAYLYAWNAYTKYASGFDELLPLTATGINDWYGWGVTVVDGIDTAIVMGLTDVVEQQLAFIEKIDFTTTKYGPVEIFDTNIRYLGGLLSAYDLLKSGQFPNHYNPLQVDALLKQAISLGKQIVRFADSNAHS